MKSQRRLGFVSAVLLLWAVSALSIFAQDDAPPPQYQDQDQGTMQAGPQSQAPASSYPDQDANVQSGAPGAANVPQNSNNDPSGRVARIQYMSGEVSMQPGGVNDWVAASMNRPLTTSDRVWTDKNSKAELNVGDGFMRMNSETSLTLSNVADNTVQLELDQGTLELTVLHLEPGEIYEVDTPNTAFTVAKPGVYRFDVFPNEDQSWITVRKGWGTATGKGPAVKVASGQQVRFRGGNSLVHTAEAAPAPDGFDDWANVRDARLKNSVSARYVAPGTIGYQDLDQYGTWRTVAPYGPVWVPSSVPAGWAPYRYGHWVWIAPWGWTWVDDAPWGFAPFHYGRWVNTGGYWGWAPGPVYAGWNPYYAPALVGWIGGPGFGIGFGWGGGGFSIGVNFGWFALGWGEPFYPWYRGWGGGWCSRGYFNRVNITNTRITNITNITNNYYNGNIARTNYANRNIAGAVTAAPRSAIVNGQSMMRAGVAVPKADLGKGQLLRTGINATPTRQSMTGGLSSRNGATPPNSAFSRGVVRQNPTPAHSPANAARQANIAQAGHSPMNATRSTAAQSPNGAHNNTQMARETAPSNPAAHNVPRPPSAGGTVSNIAGQSGTTHNVPRPPAANDSFARGGSNASHPTSNATMAERTNPNAGASHNQPTAQNTRSNVPRPPANYHPQMTTANGSTNATHSSSVPQAQHQAAPSSHQSSGSSSHQGSGSKSEGHGGMASSSVPRPPSSYQYHAAPAYNASSSYGTNRASGYAGGSASNGYSNARGGSYGGGAYSGGNSVYATNRGYSSAPGYSASRSYGGAAYSSPHGGGYSQPHNSSSGGGAHYSGGGGGSHSSGGGGGHSGGGHSGGGHK